MEDYHYISVISIFDGTRAFLRYFGTVLGMSQIEYGFVHY
jgi:hypothetical protein